MLFISRDVASSIRTVTFQVADVEIRSAVYVVPPHPSKCKFPYNLPLQRRVYSFQRLEEFLVDKVALGLGCFPSPFYQCTVHAFICYICCINYIRSAHNFVQCGHPAEFWSARGQREFQYTRRRMLKCTYTDVYIFNCLSQFAGKQTTLLRPSVSALPGKELKRRFVVSNISVGNSPLCPGQPVAHELQVERLWSRYCQVRARYHIQSVPGGMCQTSGECSLS